jgi:hypothetical protein
VFPDLNPYQSPINHTLARGGEIREWKTVAKFFASGGEIRELKTGFTELQQRQESMLLL